VVRQSRGHVEVVRVLIEAGAPLDDLAEFHLGDLPVRFRLTDDESRVPPPPPTPATPLTPDEIRLDEEDDTLAPTDFRPRPSSVEAGPAVASAAAPAAAPAARVEEREEPSTKDLNGGRLLNLLGLVSPVANVAMLQFSPREMRWMGIGAGVILGIAGGWGAAAGIVWLKHGAFGLHYLLVLLGLIHPRLPEKPFGWWIKFGQVLGQRGGFVR